MDMDSLMEMMTCMKDKLAPMCASACRSMDTEMEEMCKTNSGLGSGSGFGDSGSGSGSDGEDDGKVNVMKGLENLGESDWDNMCSSAPPADVCSMQTMLNSMAGSLDCLKKMPGMSENLPDIDNLQDGFQGMCSKNAGGNVCGRIFIDLNDDDDSESANAAKCAILADSGCCAGSAREIMAKLDGPGVMAKMCGDQFNDVRACAKPGAPLNTVRTNLDVAGVCGTTVNTTGMAELKKFMLEQATASFQDATIEIVEKACGSATKCCSTFEVVVTPNVQSKAGIEEALDAAKILDIGTALNTTGLGPPAIIALTGVGVTKTEATQKRDEYDGKAMDAPPQEMPNGAFVPAITGSIVVVAMGLF